MLAKILSGLAALAALIMGVLKLINIGAVKRDAEHREANATKNATIAKAKAKAASKTTDEKRADGKDRYSRK